MEGNTTFEMKDQIKCLEKTSRRESLHARHLCKHAKFLWLQEKEQSQESMIRFAWEICLSWFNVSPPLWHFLQIKDNNKSCIIIFDWGSLRLVLFSCDVRSDMMQDREETWHVSQFASACHPHSLCPVVVIVLYCISSSTSVLVLLLTSHILSSPVRTDNAKRME